MRLPAFGKKWGQTGKRDGWFRRPKTLKESLSFKPLLRLESAWQNKESGCAFYLYRQSFPAAIAVGLLKRSYPAELRPRPKFAFRDEPANHNLHILSAYIRCSTSAPYDRSVTATGLCTAAFAKSSLFSFQIYAEIALVPALWLTLFFFLLYAMSLSF